MALDYIIGGLQLLAAAVNVLALGAFWISPGLRATANRFVINLLVANIIACLALSPALWPWWFGGLKTRFHMDNSVAATIQTSIHHQSSPNLQFQTDDQMIDMHGGSSSGEDTASTVNSLHNRHHQKQQQQQAYSYHRANRYERDVEQQPAIVDSAVQSAPLHDNQFEKSSVESLIIERDERGNIKFSEKQIVDIQNGDIDKDEIEIVAEIDASAAAPPSIERTPDADTIGSENQHSSTSHHRIYTVFSENALIFDCTRFYGYDFAAAVGKSSPLLYLFFFNSHVFWFHAKGNKIHTS